MSQKLHNPCCLTGFNFCRSVSFERKSILISFIGILSVSSTGPIVLIEIISKKWHNRLEALLSNGFQFLQISQLGSSISL